MTRKVKDNEWKLTPSRENWKKLENVAINDVLSPNAARRDVNAN